MSLKFKKKEKIVDIHLRMIEKGKNMIESQLGERTQGLVNLKGFNVFTGKTVDRIEYINKGGYNAEYIDDDIFGVWKKGYEWNMPFEEELSKLLLWLGRT